MLESSGGGQTPGSPAARVRSGRARFGGRPSAIRAFQHAQFQISTLQSNAARCRARSEGCQDHAGAAGSGRSGMTCVRLIFGLQRSPNSAWLDRPQGAGAAQNVF